MSCGREKRSRRNDVAHVSLHEALVLVLSFCGNLSTTSENTTYAATFAFDDGTTVNPKQARIVSVYETCLYYAPIILRIRILLRKWLHISKPFETGK